MSPWSVSPSARFGDGKFAPQARGDSGLSLAVGGYVGDDGRYYLGDEGECPDCNHLQAPGSPCENCDPSCDECYGPRQDFDASLCDSCAEKEAEHTYYSDEDDQ